MTKREIVDRLHFLGLIWSLPDDTLFEVLRIMREEGIIQDVGKENAGG